MSILWLLLIPYCTLAFGIHGGEFITGINRQVRNLICAIPFGLVCCTLPFSYSYALAFVSFSIAYLGSNLGFDWFPSTGWKYYFGLAIKGFITCPFGGFITLPIAYWIGYKTKYTNVLAEYLSGTLYGGVLCATLFYVR